MLIKVCLVLYKGGGWKGARRGLSGAAAAAAGCGPRSARARSFVKKRIHLGNCRLWAFCRNLCEIYRFAKMEYRISIR